MTADMVWYSMNSMTLPVAHLQADEVSFRATIAVERERAWELLSDLSLAHNYVPGVVDTRIVTERKTGVGASREVYQGKEKSMNETVEEWNDGYGFLIRLHCGGDGPPFPFKAAWFSYAIEDSGVNTILTARLIYVMRWGCIGRWLDRILLKRFVKSRIRDVALGLKIYYETGKRVTPYKLNSLKTTL